MGWTPLTRMSNNIFEKEKNDLTPETGFNLVGVDYFADNDGDGFGSGPATSACLKSKAAQSGLLPLQAL